MQATRPIVVATQPGDWEDRLEQARTLEQERKAALIEAQQRLDAATERYDQTNRKQARGEYTTAPHRLLLAVQEAQEERDGCSTALALARGLVQAAAGEVEFDRLWPTTRHSHGVRPLGGS